MRGEAATHFLRFTRDLFVNGLPLPSAEVITGFGAQCGYLDNCAAQFVQV